MIVSKSEALRIDFNGLHILDFTANETGLSSSLALIEVPAGSKHGESWSKRSDKYYLVIDGTIRFTLGSEEFDLNKGDFCLVKQGERFNYKNVQTSNAQLVLMHTPAFDLDSEIFVNEQ